MKTPTETEVLRGLLRLALKYLEHPEVANINFARSSGSVARQIREQGLGEQCLDTVLPTTPLTQ